MAKRRASGTSAFNSWVGGIPREEHFSVAFPADTTTETWVDVDTNLLDGYAWALYGIEYIFQDASTFQAPIVAAATFFQFTLQVHRNDDHELLIAHDDDDLWIHDAREFATSTQGAYYAAQPFERAKPSITFASTLRVIFRSDTDITTLAATDNLAGIIYYDIVKAPTAAQTKLGYIAEM